MSKIDDANILISDLNQIFTKNDFQSLQVVGQFNKGFILSVHPHTSELFILDQHACDEKFNFETLSCTT